MVQGRRTRTFSDLFKARDPNPLNTAWQTALGASTGQWSLQQLQSGRENFLDAIPIMFPAYKSNWHHVVLAEALQKVADGRVKKLIVSLPPQHMKTMSCSELFPAWILGRQNEAIMAGAYSQSRANDVASAVGRFMNSDGYKALFPMAPIPSRSDSTRGWKRMSNNFNVIGYEAERTYLGIGVGGSGTGYPRSLGIVDDPVKNYEDAISPVHQMKTQNWYSSVYGSRENQLRSSGVGVRDIIVMTRWSENDLAGYLLQREGRLEEGGQWMEVNIPAIMDEIGLKTKHPLDPRGPGEALWPAMRDIDRLLAQRNLAPQIFEALYQGRPNNVQAGLFQYDWFRRFRDTPEGQWVMSCDLNFGATGKQAATHSKASIGIWVVDSYAGHAYLVDELWETYSFPECLAAIQGLYRKYPKVSQTLIEAKASGPAMIQTLSQYVPGVTPVQPTRSKMARAGGVAPYCEAGRVHVIDGPVGDDFLGRVCRFPDSGTDDSVDQMTQLLSAHLGVDVLRTLGFLTGT